MLLPVGFNDDTPFSYEYSMTEWDGSYELFYDNEMMAKAELLLGGPDASIGVSSRYLPDEFIR